MRAFYCGLVACLLFSSCIPQGQPKEELNVVQEVQWKKRHISHLDIFKSNIFHKETLGEQIDTLIDHCMTNPSPSFGSKSLEELKKIQPHLTQGFWIELDKKFWALELTPPQKEFFITGYYSPTYRASLVKNEIFRYPIYSPPKDLKEDHDKYTRANIDSRHFLKGRNLEIAYLSSPLDVFFLHVQGSGRLTLPDNSTINLGVSQTNRLPYTSIGKLLIQDGKISAKDMSMQSIRKFFKRNPDLLRKYLNKNKRYIFFKINNSPPMGSTSTPVVAYHSIATERFQDGSYRYPPFTPFLLYSKFDSEDSKTLFVFHQDTGSAIKGVQRMDLYTGSGDAAGQVAGRLKSRGKAFALWPKSLPLPKNFAGLVVNP